jgi:hypothetical protein
MKRSIKINGIKPIKVIISFDNGMFLQDLRRDNSKIVTDFSLAICIPFEMPISGIINNCVVIIKASCDLYITREKLCISPTMKNNISAEGCGKSPLKYHLNVAHNFTVNPPYSRFSKSQNRAII